MRELPSPNHDERPAGRDVDILVIHYTGMVDAATAFGRLLDPAAKVSCHYVIDEDGTVTRMVPEHRRAWHAGLSYWRGARDINSRSIGIELVNPGHEFGYRAFTRAQMEALVPLACAILARHPIPPRNVVGHSDIAPLRKQDPGELFDWAALARRGIGMMPPPDSSPPARDDVALDIIQGWLAGIGYDIPPSGEMDSHTEAVITAFQRHYRPARVDGRLDAETVARIMQIVRLAG